MSYPANCSATPKAAARRNSFAGSKKNVKNVKIWPKTASKRVFDDNFDGALVHHWLVLWCTDLCQCTS
jgi:hypothetical protein